MYIQIHTYTHKYIHTYTDRQTAYTYIYNHIYKYTYRKAYIQSYTNTGIHTIQTNINNRGAERQNSRNTEHIHNARQINSEGMQPCINT